MPVLPVRLLCCLQLLLENEILKAAILDLRLGNSKAARALVTDSHATLGGKHSAPGPDQEADEFPPHVPTCVERILG